MNELKRNIADCNDYVDNIGFNKIYKYTKNINFFDGIEGKDNGPVEEYLYGIFNNLHEGYGDQSFYILKFKNIKFPTFYAYNNDNKSSVVPESFKVEIDNDPIPKFFLNYSMYDFGDDDEEVEDSNETQWNSQSLEDEEDNKNEYDDGNDFGEDDFEEDEQFLVNGKNTSLIKRFFNKEVIKDFGLFGGLSDFIESRDKYIIFVSYGIDKINERHMFINKLLEISKKLEQHVDSEFRNE